MEKLEITSFGTIKNYDGFEVTLEKFIKKLEKKIKNRDRRYSVYAFGNGDYCFDIRYADKEYRLTMHSFYKSLIGEKKYNDIISSLNRLSDIEHGIIHGEETKKIELQNKETIIANADKDIISSDEDRLVYLEELKHRKKEKIFLRKEVKDIFNLGSFLLTLLFSVICSCIGRAVDGILNDDVTLITLSSFLVGFAIIPFSFTIENSQETMEQKRILKHKIKSLEESLNRSPLDVEKVNQKNKRGEKKGKYNKLVQQEIKAYPYEFKDTIYKRTNGLLDKIDSLNNNDEKIELKGKIMGILQEYREGLKLEQNIGPVELSVSKCKNIEVLRSKIRNGLVDRLGSKLDDIDTCVNGMLDKQNTEQEREKERLLLGERLESVVIDSNEIDGVLKQRKENFVPAPVRSRGKTGKVKSRALYTKY